MGEELSRLHHGVKRVSCGCRTRPARRCPRKTCSPGSAEPYSRRRGATEPGQRPARRGGRCARSGVVPYVAVPAGVVPARARGADPTRHSAAAPISTTTESSSTVKASLAKGASHESLNPKSPIATERRKPARVLMTNPIPISAAQSRRRATTPRPTTSPAIDCRRKRGPMVGMER